MPRFYESEDGEDKNKTEVVEKDIKSVGLLNARENYDMTSSKNPDQFAFTEEENSSLQKTEEDQEGEALVCDQGEQRQQGELYLAAHPEVTTALQLAAQV